MFIHQLGSVPEEGQTLAVMIDPTIRKCMVYGVPAVAANGTVSRNVVVPCTFF